MLFLFPLPLFFSLSATAVTYSAAPGLMHVICCFSSRTDSSPKPSNSASQATLAADTQSQSAKGLLRQHSRQPSMSRPVSSPDSPTSPLLTPRSTNPLRPIHSPTKMASASNSRTATTRPPTRAPSPGAAALTSPSRVPTRRRRPTSSRAAGRCKRLRSWAAAASSSPGL